jgi:hypothetical protein
MTHQEYNTLMRLIGKKVDLGIAEAAGRSDITIAELEEEVDELTSVLRAHLCVEGDD